MLKILLAATLLSTPALAQMQHTPGMQMGGAQSGVIIPGQMTMQGVGGSPLSEPGQSAFATIAEVVAILVADPETDWSQVNIDTLREHLQDMDRVTLDSVAVAEEVAGGIRFLVTGTRYVSLSIQRMVIGHASVMDGVDGWRYSGEIIANGAAMTVLVPEVDMAKLEALGFYGLLAAGPHHLPHHWAMANGLGMGMN